MEWESIGRLVLAILIGGLIGAEREFHHKAAGFRTLIFICLGATLFTMFSVRLSGTADATRIVANIVSGVGFLGGGVILHDAGRVVGLTTAAAIWLTAALGMGIGAGDYSLVAVSAVLALVVLWVFPALAARIERSRGDRIYEIFWRGTPEGEAGLEARFEQHRLRVRWRRRVRTKSGATWTWQVIGPAAAHEALARELLADENIKEFRIWS